MRASAASGLAFFLCTIVAGYAVKFLFFAFDWDREYSPESWFALDLQHFMLGAVGMSSLAITVQFAQPFGYITACAYFSPCVDFLLVRQALAALVSSLSPRPC